MDQGFSELVARVDGLGDRIARLERYLGMAGAPVSPTPLHREMAPVRSPLQTDSAPTPVGIRAASSVVAAPMVGPASVKPAPARGTPSTVKTGAPGERAVVSAFSIEKVIGARLFAGVGALAIVIGVGLFLKFAYDQGWMGRVPPVGRCVMAGAFGLVLLGAGEWARRRINALASAGLSSAGVGVLYATAFGAYAQWQLVSSAGAMGLLIGACVIGLAVGARAGLASVAALSLVGGYMAPMVIGSSGSISPVFFPVYLTALFVVGLALSGWMGRRLAAFHRLRFVCWIGTGGLGTIWLLAAGIPDHQGLALLFVGAVWAVTHAERVASIRQLFVPGGGIDASSVDGMEKAAPMREGRALMGSFSATAWATGFGAWALESGSIAPSWLAPAALLAPTALVGLVLAGHLRGLRDAPRTEGERFGVGLLAQAGALLIVMTALTLSGWTQAIAWLALGLASILSGRWMRSRALDWYGVLALTFATARLWLLISLGVSAGGAGVSYWGVHIDLNSMRIALTALAWLVAGALLLIRLGRARPIGSGVAFIVGLSVLMFTPLHARSEAGPICMAWMGIGAASLLAGCRARFGVDRMVNHALINFGLVVMSLGTLRQVGMTLTEVERTATGLQFAGVFVTANTWRVLTAAILWLGGAGAMLLNNRDSMRARTVMASQFGLALLALAPAHPASEAQSICIVLLALSAAAFAAGARVLPRWIGWSFSGIGLLTLSVGAWATAYFQSGWNATPAPIGLHPGLWIALLIGAVAICAARWFNPLAPDSRERARAVWASMAVATALFFVASSFEVARGATQWASQERARQAVVSIYWGLFAVGLLVAGFLRGAPVARYAGLGLMSVAALKAVLVDLSAAPPAWRIVSFTGLGLLMVGVALAYSRIAARVEAAKSARRTDTSNSEPGLADATLSEDGL